LLAHLLGRGDPRHRPNPGPRIAWGDPHDHGGRAPRASSHRAAARALTVAWLGRGRHRARGRIPDRERACGARELTIAAAPLVLAIAACGAFVPRKRLNILGPFALVARAAACALACLSPPIPTRATRALDRR